MKLLTFLGLSPTLAFRSASPNGVPTFVAYPTFESFRAPLDCETSGNDVLPAELRPDSGLVKSQCQLMSPYVAADTPAEKQQLIFETYDKRTLNDFSRCVSGHLLVQERENVEVAFSEAYCKCLGFRFGAYACDYQQSFFTKNLCHSDIPFYKSTCDNTGGNNYNVPVPEECSAPLTRDVLQDDLPLENNRYPTSNSVPDIIDATDVQKEGKTYYLAWKMVHRFTRFSESNLNDCDSSEDIEFYTGYQNQLYIRLSLRGDEEPIFGVLTKKDSTFVLVLRDSSTTFEGKAASMYDQTNYKTGRIHKGYNTVAQAILPKIQSYFHRVLTDEVTGWTPMSPGLTNPKLVVVASGNLGGGVGAIVADQMTDFIRQKKYGNNFKVEAILFNAPYVGDGEFTSHLGREVNVRSIHSPHLLPAVCPTTPRCDEGVVYGGGNDEKFYTSMNIYSPLPGKVAIDSLTDTWMKSQDNVDPFYFDHAVLGSYGCQKTAIIECWLTQFCRDADQQLCKDSKLCQPYGDITECQ